MDIRDHGCAPELKERYRETEKKTEALAARILQVCEAEGCSVLEAQRAIKCAEGKLEAMIPDFLLNVPFTRSR